MGYRSRSRRVSFCPSDYRPGDEDNPGSPDYDEAKGARRELEDLRRELPGLEEELEGAKQDGISEEIAAAEAALAKCQESIEACEELAGDDPEDDGYDEEPYDDRFDP